MVSDVYRWYFVSFDYGFQLKKIIVRRVFGKLLLKMGNINNEITFTEPKKFMWDEQQHSIGTTN